MSFPALASVAGDHDSVEATVQAPFDHVVDFLMDLRNIQKFAFGKDVPVEIELLSDTRMRVYNPLTKTVTVCENHLARTEQVAVVEHLTLVEQENLVWRVFLLLHDFGTCTHVLFGWFNTPEVKAFMCRMHGWEAFDARFVREEVARKELGLIKQLVEADNRDHGGVDDNR